MGKCRKRSIRVVVGHSVSLKRKVDDQTIIDNCEISRVKISMLKMSMAIFRSSQLEQVRRTHVVICYCYWSFD